MAFFLYFRHLHNIHITDILSFIPRSKIYQIITLSMKHMKYLFLFVLFLAFFVPESISQTLIKEKAVPETVKRRFDQKYRTAKEIKWFENEKERTYTAKFLEKGTATMAILDLTGKVIESQKNVELDKLNNKISTNLRDEYRHLEPIKATLIERGRRDKYFSIILHENMGRKKEPLVYEIQYNFQGEFITIYEPDVEEEIEEEKRDKYDESLEEDMDEMSAIKYNIDVKKSDLPSKVTKYLRNKYDLDYRYNAIKLNKDDEFGPHYYVEMKKLGEGNIHVFWFNINGKLLKQKTEDLEHTFQM